MLIATHRVLTTILLGAILATAQTPAPDLLGRDTPRGTLIGFLQAAQQDTLAQAALFLQVPENERETRGVLLARELSAVLDRTVAGTLDSVSNHPDGDLNDGLPPDRELAGVITVDGRRLTLQLVRTDGPEGRVWLLAAETLAQVPTWYARVGFPRLEQNLPPVLVQNYLLAIPLWKWLAALLMLPLALGLGWVASRFIVGSGRRADQWWRPTARGPLAAMLAMLAHLAFVNSLGIPLIYSYYYYRLVLLALIAGAAWMLWRIVDHGFRRAFEIARADGRGAAASLLQMGRRLLKAFILVAVLIACLKALGFETSGIVTGLGIGGIALALAAQKTIENLFGGVSLVSDKVFRVGDVCKLGDRVGVIEDIGLRSTRLRTKERSELSVPNGALAAMNIENLSRRDRILIEKTILVRVDTTTTQLDQILAAARKFVGSHPKLAADGRVRLVAIEEIGQRLEVFAFVETTDYAEFLAVQEEVLVRITSIIREAGAELASRHAVP